MNISMQLKKSAKVAIQPVPDVKKRVTIAQNAQILCTINSHQIKNVFQGKQNYKIYKIQHNNNIIFKNYQNYNKL